MKKFYLALLSLLAIVPTLRAVEPSGTLPVLVIETKNRQPIVSKEEYLEGTYYLDPRGCEGVEAFGSAESPLPLQIKGRGNWTWTFNKKPYRLKLDDKAALLGMNKSKHFALLAHADDNRAFMRNATGFEVSRMSGLPWTPADKPCEVILNGDYIGLYFLTETIRFDKKRVNMTNPDDTVDDWLAENPDKTADDYPFTDEDYTGAWLVEFDNYTDPCQVVVNSRQSEEAELWITYKSPEDYVTNAHREWLKNEFDAIDELIYADNHADGAWLDKIDLTDAARFFVVNQIMNNYESYHGSCYLVKDKGADQKWHFGPVWDFGSSFVPSADVSNWIWNSVFIQHWIQSMYDCPEFQAEVKRIFELMDTEGFDRIFNYQNEYAARITEAAKRDAERWQSDGYGNADMETRLNEVQKQLQDAINHFGHKLGVAGYETLPLDIYLRGTDVGGWDAINKYLFTATEDGKFELFVEHLSGEFKIADKSWGEVDLGSNSKSININEAYQLVSMGPNLTLANGSADNVKMILDLDNLTLTVTDQTGTKLVVVPAEEGVEYYNLQGMRVTAPRSGEIYIVKTPKGTTKTLYR